MISPARLLWAVFISINLDLMGTFPHGNQGQIVFLKPLSHRRRRELIDAEGNLCFTASQIGHLRNFM